MNKLAVVLIQLLTEIAEIVTSKRSDDEKTELLKRKLSGEAARKSGKTTAREIMKVGR